MAALSEALGKPVLVQNDVRVGGYAVEAFADADATQLRLSDLLTHLPVAALRARYTGAAKPARRRGRG